MMTRQATEQRPRTKPPEERRDELMNAAQHLFLKQGVAPTTIEQITSQAGVAKGTFYLYFSSKEEVLAALGERFGQGLLKGIQAAIAAKPQADWKAMLATWARACVSGYLDSIQLHDMIFLGSHRPKHEHDHEKRREGLVDNVVIDHLAELLQAGMGAGAWSIDDVRFTAVFLFNGLHSVVDDAYSREKRLNRSRLRQRVEDMYFRSVGLNLL
jgi:AcrR family transcriptional regulator